MISKLALITGLATVPHITYAQDEVRAVWSSRFGWPGSTEAESKSKISTLMANVQTGKFNTVFFQIRGQCDVFYDSEQEPWAASVRKPDGEPPDWDPLLHAIEQAHSRDIKLHAYFNTHTIWGPPDPPNTSMFGGHVYYTQPDWHLYDDNGNPAGHVSEYYWMNPGIPEADAHVRREAAHVVSNYDVDGLHFDRCRMPQPGYGKNPIAVARWDNPATGLANDGPGNPERLGWDAFMRDCVTRQMTNIAGACWLADRTVLMSAAPLGLRRQSDYSGYPAGFQYGFARAQDAKAWMEMGALDFVVPQIYWSDTDASLPDFDDVFNGWIVHANNAGRALVPGSNLNKGLTEVQNHAFYSRANGGAGHCVWHGHNSAINYPNWDNVGKPHNGSTPAFPHFAWRDTEGVITGHIFEDPSENTAAVDAWVTRNGSTHTALTSGDGFFCFLRVPPGTYTLTIKHPSLGPTGTKIIPDVEVVAGHATDVSTALPVSLSRFSLE